MNEFNEVIEGRTEQAALPVSMMRGAQTGDVGAATFIRDTIGEKPKDKLEHSGTIDLAKAINEARVRSK